MNNENTDMIIRKPKYEKKYKCPYCNYKGVRSRLVTHIDKNHEDLIPENYSAARVVYNMINKRDHGTCMMCKKPTEWNEQRWKYEALCSQKCHDDYVKMVKARMKKKYGKEHLLNDPKQQEKMLANRSISGTYKFKDGGVRSYCGSYERKLLEFFDLFLNVNSKDIVSPGPVIEYEYKGEKHQWITDQYYTVANLVFDVKDGGEHPNNRKMDDYRAKQLAKEKAIKEQGKYNYIRLTDNNFQQLLYILAEIKELMMDPNSDKDTKIVRVNESATTIGAIPPRGECEIVVNEPIKPTFTDSAYVLPFIQNGKVTNTAFTTDKFFSKVYTIKDSKFTKVDIKEIDNLYSTVLKYTGDDVKEKVDKILSTDESEQLNPDYFYETLTGRESLDPNQILFDENFVEVLDGYTESLIRQSIIKNTLINEAKKLNNPNIIFEFTSIEDTEKINNLLKDYNNLKIYQDIDGYYIENIINNYRSQYFKNIDDIDLNIMKVLSEIVKN